MRAVRAGSHRFAAFVAFAAFAAFAPVCGGSRRFAAVHGVRGGSRRFAAFAAVRGVRGVRGVCGVRGVLGVRPPVATASAGGRTETPALSHCITPSAECGECIVKQKATNKYTDQHRNCIALLATAFIAAATTATKSKAA